MGTSQQGNVVIFHRFYVVLGCLATLSNIFYISHIWSMGERILLIMTVTTFPFYILPIFTQWCSIFKYSKYSAVELFSNYLLYCKVELVLDFYIYLHIISVFFFYMKHFLFSSDSGLILVTHILIKVQKLFTPTSN